jgi:putative sterol carrier protein
VAGTVQVHLTEGSFHVLVTPGGVTYRDGAAPRADAVLTTSAETAAAVAAGRTSLREAVSAGDAKLEGPETLTGALLTL